ncbi:hypothetical protein R1flu_006188 [Riccia fluitans]|uniref:Glycosyltransferase 61 catalytic domain-containing protein n=1 Tax=Riccia fluitans TaxID=41844 RepID=A0ABD1YWB9_9MARC
MVYLATFEELQSVWQPEPPTGPSPKKLTLADGETWWYMGRGGVLLLQKLLQIGIFMCFLVACYTAWSFHEMDLDFIPFLLECSWGRAVVGKGSNDETFWCDRLDKRSDVCFVRGNVLLYTGNISDVVLRTSNPRTAECQQMEIIRPYTRKWEPTTMASVEPVTLRVEGPPNRSRLRRLDLTACDVRHSVAAVLFSTGGFTGNPYHDFQDVLIPLYVTSQHWRGEVVFVINDLRWWWVERWGDVLQQLTKYPIIYTDQDTRSHCFPEMTIGLYVHQELGIDSARMLNGESMLDFQNVLGRALGRPCRELEAVPKDHSLQLLSKSMDPGVALGDGTTNITRQLRLLIVGRTENRLLLNEKQIIRLANSLGFKTQVLTPTGRVQVRRIYSTFHESDVVVGVHGAGLAHIVFMKRRAVFLQIVPLGTNWPSEHYYKQPAMDLGLQYVEYAIQPKESSLSQKYGYDHPIVNNPSRFTSKGWATIKQIYLSNQNLRLNLKRLRGTLLEAKVKALAASLTEGTDSLACL